MPTRDPYDSLHTEPQDRLILYRSRHNNQLSVALVEYKSAVDACAWVHNLDYCAEVLGYTVVKDSRPAGKGGWPFFAVSNLPIPTGGPLAQGDL